MTHLHHLEPLNIFGRYAYALTCLEKLCQHWDITAPFILKMIEAHWLLLEKSQGYDQWCQETDIYTNLSPERLAIYIQETSSLTPDQIQSIDHAIYELRALVDADMYCKPESFRSMRHLINVMNILLRWEIKPPSLEAFAKATYSRDEFGYYGPYQRKDFVTTQA